MERLRDIMPKKQVALVLAGAVVVASAAYLYFRSRPKKQIPHGKAPIFQSPQVAAQAPVQKNVEELQLQIDAGDTSAMCKLALLHLKGDDASGLKQDVPRALDLLHQAAENGGVEAMMCEFVQCCRIARCFRMLISALQCLSILLVPHHSLTAFQTPWIVP